MFDKPPANDFLITHACCGADCPRCPFERLTLDDTVSIDVDGDTYARLAAAADAAGESVDAMAERALTHSGCPHDCEACTESMREWLATMRSSDAGTTYNVDEDELPLLGRVMLAEQDECDCGDVPNVRHLDPDGHLPGCPESNTYALYLLQNLLAVIHGDGGHYSEEHGIKKAADDAEAKYVSIQSALRHANAIGMVDVDAVATSNIELQFALCSLLDAFPRLGKDCSGAEQQEALRRARKAVGR